LFPIKYDFIMPTPVFIIDYGIGNVLKVNQILRYQGFDPQILTRNTDAKKNDTGVLLIPGIGHFDACAIAARKYGVDELVQNWQAAGKGIIGICVGAQLLLESSEEGSEPGFGLIRGRVLSNKSMNRGLNVGRGKVIFKNGIHEHLNSTRYYFSHNYHLSPEDQSMIYAYDSNGFPAVIKSGRVMGIQFHPEKSGPIGSRLLKTLIAEVTE
jgi:glutamine amidotransferase